MNIHSFISAINQLSPEEYLSFSSEGLQGTIDSREGISPEIISQIAQESLNELDNQKGNIRETRRLRVRLLEAIERYSQIHNGISEYIGAILRKEVTQWQQRQFPDVLSNTSTASPPHTHLPAVILSLIANYALSDIGELRSLIEAVTSSPQQELRIWMEISQKQGMTPSAIVGCSDLDALIRLTQENIVNTQIMICQRVAEGNSFLGSIAHLSRLEQTRKMDMWMHEPARQKLTGEKIIELGHCYIYGKGVSQSHIRGAALFQQAVNLGSPEAYPALAQCYRYGYGVPKDLARFFSLLQQGAAQGCDRAICILSKCYIEGIGIDQNVDQGIAILEAAAKRKECVEVQCALGFYYKALFPDRATASVDLFMRSALGGNSEASYYLARCYKLGFGVFQNAGTAAIHFLAAASQGHASAQCELGLLYEQGEGVIKNRVRAADLFKQAADQGDPFGCYKFALCLFLGIGVTQDRALSITLFQKAAFHGIASAQRVLAFYYEKGLDGSSQRNPARATFYSQKAAGII